MAPPYIRANLLLVPVLSLAAACAPEGSFPSLAPRAVERLSTEEPVRAEPAVPADPSLSGQVAQLLASARKGNADFQAELPAARASVARAGAAGSDDWVEAQQAVSRLEGARAETAAAVTQLDALSIERAARPTNAADFQALLGALEIAQSLADGQKAEIDRLQGQLRPI
jgi:hypothetical protein